MSKVTEQAKNAIIGALNGTLNNTVVHKRTYHYDATTSTAICHVNGKQMIQYAIELPWRENQVGISCIPEGVYDVVPHISPTFGKCFLVKDVPGRSEILFHVMNYVYGEKIDSRGCIGPAKELKDINKDGHIDGSSSKGALDNLLALYPKGFTLIVTS